jgi:hypothetical protein
MQKKVKTTPLQREILWALANTGECSLPALLNSLPPKFPLLTLAALQDEVERSLRILWRAGCLYLMRLVGGERKSVLVTEMKVLGLGRLLSRDDASGEWYVAEDNVADVVVQLTNCGGQWLDLIATESTEPVPVWRPRE